MNFCDITLSGLGRNCEGNKGGISTLYLAVYQPNIFTVDDTDGVITGLASGATVDFYEYILPKGTASLTQTATRDDANGVNYITSTLNVVFHRMRAEARMEVAALLVGDVMGVVVDNNGTAYAIGNEEPVTSTSFEGNTGTAKSDMNGYTLGLSADSNSPLYTLTEDALAAVKAKVKNV